MLIVMSECAILVMCLAITMASSRQPTQRHIAVDALYT